MEMEYNLSELQKTMLRMALENREAAEIGRASWRERV